MLMRRDCGKSRSRIREETAAERSWRRREGRGPNTLHPARFGPRAAASLLERPGHSPARLEEPPGASWTLCPLQWASKGPPTASPQNMRQRGRLGTAEGCKTSSSRPRRHPGCPCNGRPVSAWRPLGVGPCLLLCGGLTRLHRAQTRAGRPGAPH